MQKRLIAIMAALMVGACGPDVSNGASAEHAATSDYVIDAESGETTATIDTGNGTATVRSGATVPIDLPKGFRLYPNAKVIKNTRFDQDNGSQLVLLNFASEDGSDEIAAYYRDVAESAGYDIKIDAMINGGALITGEDERGAVFTLSTSAEEGRTIGQLTTGLGKAAS